MTEKKLKEQFDYVVQMFYQRFLSYDNLQGDEPERQYRFGIKVFLGEDPDGKLQEILQTKSLRGGDNFITQIDRALQMKPAKIQIIEYDKNMKAVPDSGVILQVKPSKKKKTKLPTENEGGGVNGMFLGNLSSDDNAQSGIEYKLQVMGIKNEMTLELQKKDFEIRDLTRQKDDLKKLLADYEKEIDNYARQKEEGSLGNVFSGFLQKNPTLVSGLLGSITGMGKEKTASPDVSASLAGLSDEKSQIIAEVSEMVSKFNDEQFQQFVFIMQVIFTDHNSMAQITQFIQPDVDDDYEENLNNNQHEPKIYGDSNHPENDE